MPKKGRHKKNLFATPKKVSVVWSSGDVAQITLTKGGASTMPREDTSQKHLINNNI